MQALLGLMDHCKDVSFCSEKDGNCQRILVKYDVTFIF